MTKLKGIEPKSIKIPDGLHKGKVIRVEERLAKEKYWYQDIFIQVDDVVKSDGEKLEMRVSFSIGEELEINPNGELGKLVKKFSGEEIKKDEEYDTSEIFMDKLVQFQTALDEEEKYSNILKNTLKPVEEASE